MATCRSIELFSLSMAVDANRSLRAGITASLLAALVATSWRWLLFSSTPSLTGILVSFGVLGVVDGATLSILIVLALRPDSNANASVGLLAAVSTLRSIALVVYAVVNLDLRDLGLFCCRHLLATLSTLRSTDDVVPSGVATEGSC